MAEAIVQASSPGTERAGEIPAGLTVRQFVLDRFEELVGGTAFVAMTGMVFINVVCRYLLNSPIPGSDELATLAFTWAVFFGISAGVKGQLHLGIEFTTRRLPRRVQAAFGLLVTLLIAVFALLLIVYGWKIMRTGNLKLTPVLQWPYTWVYLAIPVGGLLMLVRVLPIAREHLARLRGAGTDPRPPEVQLL